MSTANTVYDHLRQAIIDGTYASGDALRQDQIARDYGVSKIPVREALVQLESDGFVEMFSGRGAFVARLSALQAEEIYLMRLSLEPILLERAIPVTPDTNWSRVSGVLAALEADKLSFFDWHALDFEFHTLLYNHADLPMIKKHVANLHRNLARYFKIYETLGTTFRDQANQEHHTILEACRAQNSDLAKAQLYEHLKRSSEHLLTLLKLTEGDDTP